MVQRHIFVSGTARRSLASVGASWESGKTALFAVAAVVLTTTPAMAQDRCPAFVGQRVAPVTIDNVIALVGKVPSVKGEFETTAAFEARRSAAASTMPAQFIVSIPVDPKYLTYNADAGTLSVGAYALDNRNTSYDGAFGIGGAHPGVAVSSFSNLDLVVGETETPTRTYRASNAYGANVTVTEIERVTKAIFERALETGDRTFVTQDKDQSLIDLPMSPDEARRFKSAGRAAAVIVPTAPYFAIGRKHWSPRIDRPTDITQTVQVVVADIQCVLLTDSTNRVLGAVAVR